MLGHGEQPVEPRLREQKRRLSVAVLHLTHGLCTVDNGQQSRRTRQRPGYLHRIEQPLDSGHRERPPRGSTIALDKIEVLSAAGIIADAIDAVFEDSSVSEIFDGQNQT